MQNTAFRLDYMIVYMIVDGAGMGKWGMGKYVGDTIVFTDIFILSKIYLVYIIMRYNISLWVGFSI